jgi:hypothetical protein
MRFAFPVVVGVTSASLLLAQYVTPDGFPPPKAGQDVGRLGDVPLGTPLGRRRVGLDDEGAEVSLTTLQAPKKAQRAYRLGLKSIEDRNWFRAEAQLSKAATIYPKYAPAWDALGGALVKKITVSQQRPLFVRRRWISRGPVSSRLIRVLHPAGQSDGTAMV